MDESPKALAPELSPAGSRRWFGRLVIAVILGAAIWNFIASLTVNLAIPGLARLMEADPQSPLYLGKGDINVAALFISLLELCFATIVVLAGGALFDRSPKPARRRPATVTPAVTAPSITPPAAAPSPATKPAPPPREQIPVAVPIEPPASDLPPSPPPQPPVTQTAAPPAKPSKPPKPKKVYYNIVGERIEEDDE